MPLKIKQLHCRVRITTGGRQDIQQPAAHPARPSLKFAMPAAEPRSETEPEPSQTATQERGQTSTRQPDADPARVDPQLVADRVYDLMREEVRIGRLRGL